MFVLIVAGGTHRCFLSTAHGAPLFGGAGGDRDQRFHNVAKTEFYQDSKGIISNYEQD